jgi:asparagine synthase (glutamine-hydrolysing)
MPGIVGLIGKLPREAGLLNLHEMMDALSYESFYAKGTYVDDKLGLYAGWVTHPTTDSMPSQNRDRSLTCLLSGELFASDSEGPDLVRLIEREGERCIEKLNGTFAGVVADARAGVVHLFNDRFGYERMYYARAEQGDAFFFASEAKALLRVLPKTREFDEQGLAQFLRYGCTFGERTLYRGISILPPASIWTFPPATATPGQRTYFRLEDWESDASLNGSAFQQRFEETFCKILPRYFAGSIKPALSLTGGWDTRMILAGHPIEPRTLACYTFAGAARDTTDVRQARKVAAAVKQDFSVLRLQPDFFDDFGEHAAKTIFVSDGCADIRLTHEIYLNRQARDISPLRLTGNFGSEILRSVSTFKPISLSPDWGRTGLSRELSDIEVAATQNGRRINPAQFAAFREVPWKLATIPRLASSQVRVRSPYLDLELVKLSCSRSHGFAGAHLPVSFVNKMRPDLAGIPTERGEAGGKRTAAGLLREFWYKGTFKTDYWMCERLPVLLAAVDAMKLHPIVPARHRYLDYRLWFRDRLKRYPFDVLKGSNTFVRGLLGTTFVDQTLRNHGDARGKTTHADMIALVTLELINKQLLRTPTGVRSESSRSLVTHPVPRV